MIIVNDNIVEMLIYISDDVCNILVYYCKYKMIRVPIYIISNKIFSSVIVLEKLIIFIVFIGL